MPLSYCERLREIAGADRMNEGPLLCPGRYVQRSSRVGLLYVCAVRRRRFPVGASPTRRTLQPEATGAVMEVTKWLKPSV